MKRMRIMLLSGCLLTIQGRGQTFSEWFRQKKTQLKYLHQQIEAIQAYIISTEEGYELAKDACLRISLLQAEDTALHSDHFLSLLKVKPAILHSGSVASVRLIGKNMRELCDGLNLVARDLPAWATSILSVAEGISSVRDRGLFLLDILTRNDEIAMKDAERMERIDGLHANMLRIYASGLKLYKECLSLKETL